MKVNFIVAGGQKCGTTALHEFLSHHPQIRGSEPKETDFFNYPKRFGKGLKYYHSCFKKRSFLEKINSVKFLESSPTYISDGDRELTARRILAYNKKIKIICSVRNPQTRAYSAWNMYRGRHISGRKDWWFKWMEERTGKIPDVVLRTDEEWDNFHLYVQNEINNLKNGKLSQSEILYIGKYYQGIEIFQRVFGENFLVIKNEDLEVNTCEELQKISDFLNLKPYDWKIFENKKVFKGVYSNLYIENETKCLLSTYYEFYNKKLFELTGIDYR